MSCCSKQQGHHFLLTLKIRYHHQITATVQFRPFPAAQQQVSGIHRDAMWCLRHQDQS